MANTWILIRHPEKEGDAEGVYRGNAAGITRTGGLQISEVVDRLKHWDERPELVLTSEIHRAKELAKFVAESLKVTYYTHPLFNEIEKPVFLVGKRRDSTVHEETMRSIRDLFDHDKVPEGISVKTRSQLEADTEDTFRLIEDLPINTVLLIGHAKKIASYIHWIWKNCRTLKGYYEETDPNICLDYTGVTVFKRFPNRRTGELKWHVKSLNDTAHTGLAIPADPELARLITDLHKQNTT